MKLFNIGVLAFHGDVLEHVKTVQQAAKNLKLRANITLIRTKAQLNNLNALIIPGGESTTLQILCQREKMFEKMKKIKNIFGTCAGAIILAKTILHKAKNQETLELMDIEIDRNAYGRQIESFEHEINTILGSFRAIFIRAPKIKKIGKNISIVAKNKKEIIACEEKMNGRYYLATSFHPELTTTRLHEYFLKNCILV